MERKKGSPARAASIHQLLSASGGSVSMPGVLKNSKRLMMHSSFRMGAFVALGLLAILAALGTTIIHLTESPFDFDRYQFFQIATAIIEDGRPYLKYTPNSSVGIDIFFWTHQIPPMLYAGLMKWLGIEYRHLSIAYTVEVALIVALLVACFRQHVSSKWFLIALAATLLEPTFYLYAFVKADHRWPIIFALASLVLFRSVVLNMHQRVRVGRLFLAGACASAVPLAFASWGLVVWLGLVVLFGFVCATKTEIRTKGAIVFLMSGLLTPFLAAGATVLSVLDWRESEALILLVLEYGASVTSFSVKQKVLQVGYFLATLVVSAKGVNLNFWPTGTGLVAVGCAAAWLNFTSRKLFPERERYLILESNILIGTWILLGMVSSTHIYPARLSWLMPLLILQIVFAFKWRKILGRKFHWWVVFSLANILVVFTFHFLGQPIEPVSIGYGVVAAVALIAPGLVLLSTKLFRKTAEPNHSTMDASCDGTSQTQQWLVIAMAVFVFFPVALDQAQSVTRLMSESRIVEKRRDELEYIKKELIPFIEHKKIDQSVILTNWPLQEIFGQDAHLQSVFFYRGLYGGVMEAPATLAVIFVDSRSRRVSGYGTLVEGDVFRYRQFDYRLTTSVPLTESYYALVGTPIDSTGVGTAEVKIPVKEDVGMDSIAQYFSWREEKGIALR